ncbi:MAG TPA: hypothetical protein VF883_08470 [Thermoanaerobaculia bacterium]|jgi:hypothetical protein
MSKVVTAEYLADTHMLRLVEPLDGVADHEHVQVMVTTAQANDRPWLAFQGCLSPEDADELAAIIEEEFPTEK